MRGVSRGGAIKRPEVSRKNCPYHFEVYLRYVIQQKILGVWAHARSRYSSGLQGVEEVRLDLVHDLTAGWLYVSVSA